MRKSTGSIALVLAAALAMGVPGQLNAEEPGPAAAAKAPKLPPAMVALEKSLNPRTGDVRIPEAKAVLHLGEDYYFLPAADAKRVLTEVWQNPPEAVSHVLGLVLAKDTTIFDNVWGAVITYQATGHVSDADAKDQDYAAVLANMKADDAADNQQRKAAGFPTMTLVGWAQPPSYDAAVHSLIWARELAIEGDPVNGLNYDVRLLGRTGVLSLNMVSSMGALADVRSAAERFGKAVTFEPGATYADYDAATDHTAEYGLAGLVAGGTAVAVAQKVGLFAILLKFGKFILLGLLALGGGLFALLRRMTGRRDEEEEELA